MIPCQVEMIAEICICHAKICEIILRYKTTLQNNFKNKPFTISDNWHTRNKNSNEAADEVEY